MHLIVDSQEFRNELSLLAKIVNQKPSIPILAHALVQVDEKGMRMATTNLEIGLVTYVFADVKQTGHITLPAQHLLNIVGLLPDTKLEFTLEQNIVRLRAGKYTTRLQTYAPVEFPKLPTMEGLGKRLIPGAELREGIERIRFAVPNKSVNKYFLEGAMLAVEEDTVKLAATDTHRLSYSKYNGKTGDVILEPAIVPSKTLDMLLDMLPGTEPIQYTIGERNLFFVVDGRMLFSRMMDGKFPDYTRIIPKDKKKDVILPRVALKTAIERVALTAPEVQLRFETNTLTVASKSVDFGEASEPVPVIFEGQDTITLSGAYLLDFLNAVNEDEILLSWRTNKSALLFTASKENYLYVQMPVT